LLVSYHKLKQAANQVGSFILQVNLIFMRNLEKTLLIKRGKTCSKCYRD